jgi:hypothetical protein
VANVCGPHEFALQQISRRGSKVGELISFVGKEPGQILQMAKFIAIEPPLLVLSESDLVTPGIFITSIVMTRDEGKTWREPPNPFPSVVLRALPPERGTVRGVLVIPLR